MSTPTSRECPILVIGATGTHGGTGAFLVKHLLAKSLPVRALVRVDDERARALRSAGAEVIVGDLHDHRSLLPALRGVQAAYFTYPVKAGIVEAAANFAAAARTTELPRLVVMSMAVASPEHPSPFAREHWLAEELFGWSGLATLSLRVAALFLENLTLLHEEDIRGDGVLRNSFADVPLPWMSGEDAGRLAAEALLHPERFGGARGVVYPAGAPPVSHADVARALGAHTGRTLSHETIAAEDWARRLVARSERDRRINPLMAVHIAETGAALSRPRTGARVPILSFESLTGARPQSLEEVFANRLGARAPQA